MKLKQTGTLAPADQPWQLIRDAITDLEKQEKCKRVEIDMGMWHEMYNEGWGPKKCQQCLAGSTMSRRCGVELHEDLSPNSFEPSIRNRLFAINNFRCGNLRQAYTDLRITKPSSVPDAIEIVDYHDDKVKFKSQMRKLADLLEYAHKAENLIEELQ